MSRFVQVVGAGSSDKVFVDGKYGLDSLAGFVFDTKASGQDTGSTPPLAYYGIEVGTDSIHFSSVADKGTTQVKVMVTSSMSGVYKLIWSDGSNFSFQTILILKK